MSNYILKHNNLYVWYVQKVPWKCQSSEGVLWWVYYFFHALLIQTCNYKLTQIQLQFNSIKIFVHLNYNLKCLCLVIAKNSSTGIKISCKLQLLFQKMLNFITNQKFLENFVSIYAKDNTDCFLFCIYGALLKREDLLKFVFFFEVAYLKIRSCAQCYCIWHFLVTNFTLLAFLVTFSPNIYFVKR